MGYGVYHIFGFLGFVKFEEDRTEYKKRIRDALKKAEQQGLVVHQISERLASCLSQELHGGKGSVLVIAGCFNYFGTDQGRKLAEFLSKNLNTIIMHQSYDPIVPNNFAKIFGIKIHEEKTKKCPICETPLRDSGQIQPYYNKGKGKPITVLTCPRCDWRGI